MRGSQPCPHTKVHPQQDARKFTSNCSIVINAKINRKVEDFVVKHFGGQGPIK